MLGKQKSYSSIVKPLRKMAQDLKDHATAKVQEQETLAIQKQQIDAQIAEAEMEVQKSNHTVSKIDSLLGLDLDNDGIADIDEEGDETTTN